MSAAKPYTVDTLARALAHHQSRGVVKSFNLPSETPAKCWLVDTQRIGVVKFSDAQCYAYVIGLADAEYAAQETANELSEALEAANPTGVVLGETERAIIR